MKRGLVVAGLLAAFALGWMLHPNVSEKSTSFSDKKPALNSVQTVAIRAFAELLGYYQRKDMQLTARNRALFDSLGHYQKLSAELLTAQRKADTVFLAAVADTQVSRDSLSHLCYAVVRLCELRADSAIAQRDRYALALKEQLGLQPHRVAVTLGVGPTVVVWPKRAVGLGANLSLSLRLW